MTIDANQIMRFDDQFELVYELLNELEMEVKPDGTIIDANGNILFFNGMKVLANTNPNNIHYAGQGEITFDILTNIRLSTVLFGNYLEKKMAAGMPFVSYFPDEKIVPAASDKLPDEKFFNLTVKFDNVSELSSPYFHSKCLTFIWMMFALEDEPVDLSNFDTEEYLSR